MNDFRMCLVNAKAELRAARDAHDVATAIAETAAIERGVNGKNADERARNLTVALLSDNAYNKSLAYLRRMEFEVDRLAACVANEEDAVRANEARIKEKLADALMGKRLDDAAADSICTCDKCLAIQERVAIIQQRKVN